MAQHRKDFNKGPEFADPNKNLLNIDGVLRLRQLNNNGQWVPYGKFGAGNATINTWAPLAPIELTGFIAEASIQGQDQLLWRLSPDGGTTELWWNGTGWVVPTDPILHWNTEITIDANIATFPIVTGVTQIVRFVSYDGTTTPILHGTSIYYEVQYEPTVDLMRSLAMRIASGLKVQGEFQVQVPIVPQTGPTPPPSNQVTIEDPIWTVNGPFEVYNQTNDPNFRTNLFVSAAGNTLMLSAPQTGLLVVRYVGTISLTSIHIATDVDVEKAELPAIVLQTPTSVRRRYENTNEYTELLRSLNVVRVRKSPTFEQIRVHIQCNAAWDLHGRKLRDAVYKFIEEYVETLRSVALDEWLVREWIGPFSVMHDLPEQTNTFDIPAVFSVLNWPEKYEDLPLATSINLNVWTIQKIPPRKGEASVFEPITIEEVTGGSGPQAPPFNPPSTNNYFIRNYTSGVQVGDAVYETGGGAVDRASAISAAFAPCVGFVTALDSPGAGQCTVQFSGDLSGFSGLIPGADYILSLALGQILPDSATSDPNYPVSPGNIIQRVAVAATSTRLIVTLSDEIEL